jgi:TIR domain
MLAFMSYQTDDRVVAASVSQLLATLGIQAFMAHEHIEVSMQWRDEILRQVGLANLFIPILSQRYHGSIWCLQESGIAAFRRISVIPLSIDGSIPPGALNHIQSTRIDPNAPTYANIFPGLALNHVEFLISSITQIIARSGNYRNAESNFDLIIPYLPRATDQQIVELLNVAQRNNQVANAGRCAVHYLPPLLASHGHLLDREVRAQLRETLARYQVSPPRPAF